MSALLHTALHVLVGLIVGFPAGAYLWPKYKAAAAAKVEAEIKKV